ncbi:hypothetical protein PUNSTDRAFT_53525 [Punctularia strigosozonata HHB-11173 SS5]|uniref:uncharacterized protein n=1 Tax=Punctularia strigosozonata (strain HHB-11173) TaxID=741275 RepID=UPI0004416641|nr:uncharacterized protein PUNSTDRAFT_53525 [Punctularia strigosozonata HHB-11173 SS5]EIN07133.1 hypothetical protein PUNSTDRAFT_53525 [Punctularia strigosozonata HHB-11173 SS5]
MDSFSNNTVYNLTYNAMSSVLGYPSRLLARMRMMDELLNQEAERQAALYTASLEAAANMSMSDQDANISPAYARPNPQLMPGPWGFLTSWYAIGLFAMALLINRIQHLVVPPPQPPTYDRHRGRLDPRPRTWTAPLRGAWHMLFPLDLTRTRTRLILRIPSLIFLSKAVFIWVVILLQTADLYPAWDHGLIARIGEWVAKKDTASVCWTTFGSVCGALCIGALTRGLEGRTANDGNTAPFNLFGYSFMLHVYSSPLTHIKTAEAAFSRPDKHVVVTLLLPILQLWILHVMGVRLRWSHQRLLPTAFIAVLTLTHFFYLTLFSRAPSSYPMLSYVPALLESSLLVITFLTLGLNIITQILTKGKVEWTGSRGIFGEGMRLSMDEDFAVAILRIGTGCLEASALAGLGNEVGGVVASRSALSLLGMIDPAAQDAFRRGDEDALELTGSGIGPVPMKVMKGRRKRIVKGFHNEIKHIKPAGYDGAVWDSAWYEAFLKFCIVSWMVARGWTEFLWAWIRGRRVSSREDDTNAGLADETAEGEDFDREDDDKEAHTYARFLRGEEVSDDEEGGEYSPAAFSEATSDAESTSYDTEDDDEELEEATEAVNLYADHLRAGTPSRSLETSGGSSAPVLLAHMTSSGSPLTRRRYTKLITHATHHTILSDGPSDDLGRFVLERRALTKREREMASNVEDDESRRNCVVCTIAPRDIICWPCRCLALCDGCRENLASRASAPKHSCPCCRRTVEGYSRIYIP